MRVAVVVEVDEKDSENEEKIFFDWRSAFHRNINRMHDFVQSDRRITIKATAEHQWRKRANNFTKHKF